MIFSKMFITLSTALFMIRILVMVSIDLVKKKNSTDSIKLACFEHYWFQFFFIFFSILSFFLVFFCQKWCIFITFGRSENRSRFELRFRPFLMASKKKRPKSVVSGIFLIIFLDA